MGCLAQCFGPVSQLTENSKYYSAKPPQRLRTGVLPHITIQCPVYKEGLQGVIVPTIKSIKQAICTYELQGGTANIFINDDGLQLFKGKDEHLRKERIDFYADHNIGWVARPGHGSEGFVRKGKFKKVCSCEILFLIAQVSFLRSALWRGWRDVELRWFWFEPASSVLCSLFLASSLCLAWRAVVSLFPSYQIFSVVLVDNLILIAPTFLFSGP